MACVAEAIGLSLPNSNMAPAPYKSRDEVALAAGEQVVELLARNIRPRDICTREAFENAARVVAATGGSTNGGLHLPAIDRKSVVSGKSVSVRVDLGGRRLIKKNTKDARIRSVTIQMQTHTLTRPNI